MVRQLPIILGVVLILLFTAAHASISGRFEDSDISEEQFAELLKNVPKTIGDWQGTNQDVAEDVKETAGARGYVSREYVNQLTGDRVNIWLIVGHSRDIMRHTPDICYPSSGFRMRAPENARVPFDIAGHPDSTFYTNTFIKEDQNGREIKRVFWAWYKPNDEGTVDWEAPKIVRLRFGNARSLYKLYLTSNVQEYGETADQSPCLDFAEVFLPVVENALSTTNLNTTGEQSGDSAEPTTEEGDLSFETEEPSSTS